MASMKYTKLAASADEDVRQHAFDSHDAEANTRHFTVDVDETRFTSEPSVMMLATSWMLTFLSYLFFVITMPISYWILVKKIGEFDRVVVFRLGKMNGVKGPGRFLIFPWMDRTKKVDVRATAFAIPPQQFITADGGIVEMGAEVQYGIVDVVTMITEVVDHRTLLRSLGKPLMTKLLVKKTIPQLERDKRSHENEILDEINAQARKWGIHAHKVSLSEPKILKLPENAGGNSAVGNLLKGLGLKSDQKYPTPMEYIQNAQDFENQASKNLNTCPAVSINNSHADINLTLLQSLNHPPTHTINTNFSPLATEAVALINEAKTDWKLFLQSIINDLGAFQLEPEAHGLYKIDIEMSNGSKDNESYFLQVSNDIRKVSEMNNTGKEPDVSVKISSHDLVSVVEGSLAPLQAYLTGRIQASGDLRKLTFFDKLSQQKNNKG